MPKFSRYTTQDLTRTLHEIYAAIYQQVGPRWNACLAHKGTRHFRPAPDGRRTASCRRRPNGASLFDCAWFNFTGAIPPAAAGQPVVLLIDVSGELLRGKIRRASPYAG